jgi:hypothetical protein
LAARIRFAALLIALGVCGFAAAAEPAKSDAGKSQPAKGEPDKPAPSAKSDIAKADQNRKKPLQRCDELKDKAQLECLRKARERIVEARNKREGSAEKSKDGKR